MAIDAQLRRSFRARRPAGSRRARRDPAEGEARLLADALRGRSLGEANRESLPPHLIQAAERHGVVLPLYRAFGKGAANGDLAALASSARYRRAVALQIASSSVDVSEWLCDAGVEHAIVKGPAMAAAYPDADREFTDLDVLVAPAQMPAAIAALQRHGAEILDGQRWPRDDGIAEISLGVRTGVSVDLHADLVHRVNVRRDFDFPAERLLERLTTTEVLGRQLPVLAPEDALTHVALHAMLSGGDRLIWLADLDALVRHGRIRWPVLVDRAREAGLALVTGVMLQRAATVLGTPVPPRTLRSLRRRGMLWAWLLATFERRRPTAANYDRSLHGQVLVRATRSTTITSLATLAGLIWTDVIVFVLRDRQHPWRVALRLHREARRSTAATGRHRPPVLDGLAKRRWRRR